MSPDLTDDRETPLMSAARFKDVSVIEYLVERGASLEMQDVYTKDFDVIHYAVVGGKMANLLCLIELGANASKGNSENTSPVHLAAELGIHRCYLSSCRARC